MDCAKTARLGLSEKPFLASASAAQHRIDGAGKLEPKGYSSALSPLAK